MKTNAGKERMVPIHPLVTELVRKRYEHATKLGSMQMFIDESSQTGMEMTYDKYRKRFMKAMEHLGMNHTPHEARHTFVTLGKDYKVDEFMLKLIAGHKTSDVTERTYTHRTLSQMKEEMEKIGQYRTTEEEYYIDW